MGAAFGGKTSKNSTAINNDNRVDARQTDNKIAAENSSVIASGGGDLNIMNTGIAADDAFEGFQGIIRSFLGANAEEQDASRQANRAQIDSIAGAFQGAASAGAGATAAVASAGSSSRLRMYAIAAGVVLAIVVVIAVAKRSKG